MTKSRFHVATLVILCYVILGICALDDSFLKPNNTSSFDNMKVTGSMNQNQITQDGKQKRLFKTDHAEQKFIKGEVRLNSKQEDQLMGQLDPHLKYDDIARLSTNSQKKLNQSDVEQAPMITSVNTKNVINSNEENNNNNTLDIDPCMICDCNQGVNLLNCNKNNLQNNYTSILNNKLLNYKYSIVCLSNNNIQELTKFPKLEQITRLCLSNNNIKQIQDGAFKQMTNLVFLDLSYNKLNNYILTPNAFQGFYAPDYYEPLRSLKILQLSHNNFHSLNSDIFEHLPNLEELYLNSNPIKVIDMPTHIAISSVTLLKILDLSSTGLNSLPDHILHTPRFLHTLNLSHNQFDVIPDQLKQAIELQNLNLNGNPIKIIKSFPNMQKLQTLSISFMPELQAIEYNSFSNLVSLQEFVCANNSKLSFIHAAAFSKTIISNNGQTTTITWPPLEKLVLSNNALRSLDSTLLARWDKLKVLDIRHNHWLCDCENQWLVSSLLPLLEANHPQYINGLKCREPIEMRNINLLDLDHKNYHMRCLDLYNNRPEYDGVYLFVILLCLILFLPFCINAVIWFRKRNHTRSQNLHYSRAFYIPARTSDASDIINTHYIL